MKNYYEILGISTTASDRELKKAYHELVKKLHPDSSEGGKKPGDKEKFGVVKEAYDTLRNRELRRNYDKYVIEKALWFTTKKDEGNINKAKLHYKYGRKNYGGKKYHDAVREFQIALTLDSDNALYCTWLGLSFSHIKGQLQNARKWCEKATELSPFDPDYHINLAIVFKEAGSFIMAEKLIRKAVEIDPHCKRARSWLADIDNTPSIRDKFRNIISRLKK